MAAATVAAISTVPGILPMAVAIIAIIAAAATTLCDSTTVLLFLRFWIPVKLSASRLRKPIQFDAQLLRRLPKMAGRWSRK